MVNLSDIITKGSKLMPVGGAPFRSTIDYPVNEDYTFLCEVISVAGGLVSCNKVFDRADIKKIFIASLAYEGQEGTPPDESVSTGEKVVLHRQGDDDYIILITPKIVVVTDSGNGNGVADGVSKPLAYSDPDANYHDPGAIWGSGREYLGVDYGTYYKVYVPGFGPSAITFTATAGEITWNVEVDASGKVLEFTANA